MTSVNEVEDAESISYLKQQEAEEIYRALVGPLGFNVNQLTELAGLSVATAIAEVYKSNEHNRVLLVCGPGHNGGDGLVAARHLFHFGYKPYVCYPNRTSNPALYNSLVIQVESLSIPFLSVEDLSMDFSESFDIIVDAIFGFSFHGTPRPPFDDLIRRLVNVSNTNMASKKSPAIVSIDIPSGWHVEDGDLNGDGMKPDTLVSLIAPKLCAKTFSGPHHFLSGRFVPPSIIEKFKLKIPAPPGTSICIRIGKPPKTDVSSLRENYISSEFLEEQAEAEPLDQFQKWFNDAMAAGLKEPSAMSLSTAGSDKKPSSRMVQLRAFDKDGFVWYTNYRSRKAHQISENPHASLLFFWDALVRQVRIEGPVERVSEAETEQYFHSCPRGIQIGFIAWNQSSVVPGRHVLEHEYKDLEAKYSAGILIPKPLNWGGYRLKPKIFEFWQGQQSRLHDRLRYTLEEIDGMRVWRIDRLAP